MNGRDRGSAKHGAVGLREEGLSDIILCHV